ncbi:hypothetical protein VIBHAR_06655 [Vibrio campbellii ATCC BAA-1116]|uniref:Uncharacterized protein n=1 Tax=Vibrio campbellii (strain ATCC BAA-1116) TaxID=2902295 RepID=A7N720_VIBC1|nr:hypothetical protein VIBHAR_06655 [Vibrio campbellii ATCC BAA-1116]
MPTDLHQAQIFASTGYRIRSFRNVKQINSTNFDHACRVRFLHFSGFLLIT